MRAQKIRKVAAANPVVPEDPDASEDAETVRESNVGGVIWMGRGTDCVLTNL